MQVLVAAARYAAGIALSLGCSSTLLAAGPWSMAPFFDALNLEAIANAPDGTPQPPPPPPAPTGAPRLEISKRCPNLRYVGREATFEIVVTNRGDGPATNVTITDTLPPTVEFLRADNGGSREGGNIVWRVPRMDAGQSLTMKVDVRCSQITVVRNTATVSYCVESAATCEFEVKGIPAILLECIDNPDPIEVGSETTYTIVVTNQGSSVGTNIRVEATLPDELDFVRADGATAGTASGKSVRFAPLPQLAPKARATYTVTARGVRAGDVRFRLQMNSDQIEQPVIETEATRVY